jgi:hypothetical protein
MEHLPRNAWINSLGKPGSPTLQRADHLPWSAWMIPPEALGSPSSSLHLLKSLLLDIGPKGQMQGVRGREHLPTPAPKEPMQGVRGREHLPAPAHQEQMQGVPRGGGHVDASRPGGAGGASASICQHQRRRDRCKECGGASICPHQRRKSTCKECGGASICQHQRIRSKCKECL